MILIATDTSIKKLMRKKVSFIFLVFENFLQDLQWALSGPLLYKQYSQKFF